MGKQGGRVRAHVELVVGSVLSDPSHLRTFNAHKTMQQQLRLLLQKKLTCDVSTSHSCMSVSLPPDTTLRLSLLILKRSTGPFSPDLGIVCCENEGDGSQGENVREGSSAAGAGADGSKEEMDMRPSRLTLMMCTLESVIQLSKPRLAPQPEGKAGPCMALAATSYSCTTPLLLQVAASSPLPPRAGTRVSTVLCAKEVEVPRITPPTHVIAVMPCSRPCIESELWCRNLENERPSCFNDAGAHLHAEPGEHCALLHVDHFEKARFIAGHDAHVKWLM